MVPEFSAFTASLVWLGLLHATWVGLVIAACAAWLFQLRVMNSRRVRHGVLKLALGLVVIAPLVLVVLQWAATAEVPKARLQGYVGYSSSPSDLYPKRVPQQSSAPANREAMAVSWFSSLPTMEEVIIHGATWLQTLQACGLMLWGTFCLVGGIRLAYGLKELRHLRQGSVAAEEGLTGRVATLAGNLGLRRVPQVRVHPSLDQPCLCGIFRSTVILPEPWWKQAEAEILDAVLAHELAHAQRRDPLWNVLQCLLETVMVFHAGVRWLSKSFRREREMAADALAVQVTQDPLALARAIESAAHFCAGRRSLRHVGAVFGGEDFALLPRIQELLGMTPSSPRFRIWPFAAVASAALLAVVAASVDFTRRPQNQALSGEPLFFDMGSEPRYHFSRETHTSNFSAEELARQIAFEFRVIEIEPTIWREALKSSLKALPSRGNVHGWMSRDDHFQKEMVDLILANPASSMTIAPKPTIFEAQVLTVTSGTKASGGQVVPETTIKLRGKMMWDRSVRLTLDLAATLDALDGKEAKSSRKIQREHQGSYEIPEGASLVLSLGEHSRLKGASERLIVITPTGLLLEEERSSVAQSPGVKLAALPAVP